jgi:hypothetical protein
MNYILRLCAFFIACVLSFPGWGALLFQADFETALTKTPLYVKSAQPRAWIINPNVWSNGWCYTQATHGYESYSISTRYKRTGASSILNTNNTMNKSDACNTVGVAASLLKSRQEMVLGMGIPELTTDVPSAVNFVGGVQMGEEIWYGASYYYPSDEGTNAQWWTAGNPRMNIVQFMAQTPCCSPELYVMLGNSGRVDFQIRTSSPSAPTEQVIDTYKGQFQMDRWNDLVIRWKRGYDNTGIFEAWINGVKVATRVNQPVSIHSKVNMYIAAGQYSGVDKVSRIYAQYMDAIKIGGANSSFAEVSPGSTVITCPGDPACPPIADTVIKTVNGGAAISNNQTRVPFTADVPAGHSMYACRINDANERGIFFDYVGKASGFFNVGDISQIASTTATLKCFSESYEQRIVGGTSLWGNSGDSAESVMTGDKMGFTTGQTITRNGASTYSYGSVAGSADILGNAGDKMRFDFTYHCDASVDLDGAGPLQAGENCKNLYFAVIDYDIDDRITMEGTAGELVASSYGGGFGENVEVRNDFLGEGVYRARIKVGVTKTTPQRYKYYGGTKGSATPIGHKMSNIDIVVRKNYTTKVASKTITLESSDTDNPDLSGCTMPVVLDPSAGTYTATVSCNTTELGGEYFVVLKDTNSAPANSDAVIAGTGAIRSATGPVDDLTITAEFSGLSYQDLWVYVVHRDAATNKSTVATATFDATNKALQLGTIADPIMRGSVPLPSATYATVTIYSGNKAIDPTATVVTALQNVPVVNGVATGREEHVIPGQPSLNSIPNGTYWVLSSRPSGATYALSYGQRAIVTE